MPWWLRLFIWLAFLLDVVTFFLYGWLHLIMLASGSADAVLLAIPGSTPLSIVAGFAGIFSCSLVGPYTTYAIWRPTLISLAEQSRLRADVAAASLSTRLRWYLLLGTIPRRPRWGYLADALSRFMGLYLLGWTFFGVLSD